MDSLHECRKLFRYKAFYPVMRLKGKGRKKYVLTDILEDDVKEICTSLACEPALKSEVGNTRIMLNSLEDVLKLESYILEQYDFVLQALHDYKQSEMNADEKLKEYLNIMVVKNSVYILLYTGFSRSTKT